MLILHSYVSFFKLLCSFSLCKVFLTSLVVSFMDMDFRHNWSTQPCVHPSLFVLVQVGESISPQFHYLLRRSDKNVQNKYTHGLYILWLFTTSTFSLLHVSHTNYITFTIRGGWSPEEHLPSISLFTKRETKNMS